jgi:hypothetical protein
MFGRTLVGEARQDIRFGGSEYNQRFITTPRGLNRVSTEQK